MEMSRILSPGLHRSIRVEPDAKSMDVTRSGNSDGVKSLLIDPESKSAEMTGISARTLLANATASSNSLGQARLSSACLTVPVRRSSSSHLRPPSAMSSVPEVTPVIDLNSDSLHSPEVPIWNKSRNGSTASMYGQFLQPGNGDISFGQQNNGLSSSSNKESDWQQNMNRKVSVCTTCVQKTFFGCLIMLLVTVSWVGSTQCMKSSYTNMLTDFFFDKTPYTIDNSFDIGRNSKYKDLANLSHNNALQQNATNHDQQRFDAPFFTAWLCSMGTITFLPLFLICNVLTGANKSSVVTILHNSIQNFRGKGFNLGKFLGRSALFSMLWILTNYLYIYSLKILGSTEVIALFATNISFIYLLSWVILHEQFVGIRIVAVILSNMGIALLAYMDGVNQTPTMGGVVLAAAGSAGFAVFKVLFKRVLGEVSFCQVAIFFSVIGLCSAVIFWPIVLILILSGIETLNVGGIPWPSLGGAVLFSLGANLLANFGVIITYEHFVTLGLVLAVPICAAIDIYCYRAVFEGMNLAGVILICCGFVVVLSPSNWSSIISKIISWGRRSQKQNDNARKQVPDLRTGHIGSRLRSPSGRVK